MSILNNIDHKQALLLKEQVAYVEGQVVSKTLVQNNGLGITLFAFAKGEGVSTHESKGDALVTALEGAGVITIDDTVYNLKEGESIVMPARHPHSVYAAKDKGFKMLLVVAFPEA
ncbi:cupin domain-containing protein [Selenomonas sp. F0473]|uniref:cupin domain-containing protein n=1 Tax=Selenomonas sp. F0473 TaxID=999423 RepID=UPI00029DFB55|nr:cupin domain-containing protein [Selenomonas sp. F0473]EKU71361.1 hypothetical protein HMPREF9161_00046 [Selenomonas sp. F0473]